MNPDFTPNPQAELEARLTAYLLGELPAHEAAALHQKIEDDPRLAQLCDQLRPTIKLLRDALANSAEPTNASTAPLKLSSARREKLLAKFKTIAPQEFAPKPKRSLSTRILIDIAAAFVILSILAGLLLPAGSKSKLIAVSHEIRGNLRDIEIAKKVWAQNNQKSDSDIPTAADLKPYLNGADANGLPRAVSGEVYNLGSMSQPATVEINTEDAKKLFGGQLHGQPLSKNPRQEILLRENGQLAVVDKGSLGDVSFYRSDNGIAPAPSANGTATLDDASKKSYMAKPRTSRPLLPSVSEPSTEPRAGDSAIVLPKVELTQAQPKPAENPPAAVPMYNFQLGEGVAANQPTPSTLNVSVPALREPQLAQDSDSLARKYNDDSRKMDTFGWELAPAQKPATFAEENSSLGSHFTSANDKVQLRGLTTIDGNKQVLWDSAAKDSQLAVDNIGKNIATAGGMGGGASGGGVLGPQTKSASTDAFYGAAPTVGQSEMKLTYANPADISSALKNLDQKAASAGAESEMQARRSRSIEHAGAVTDAEQQLDLSKRDSASQMVVTNQVVPLLGDVPRVGTLFQNPNQPLADRSKTMSQQTNQNATSSFGMTPATAQQLNNSKITASSSPSTGLVMYERTKTMTQQVNQSSTNSLGIRLSTAQAGEAAVTLDKDGHGLIAMADDDTWQQISQVVSNLDSAKAGIAVTGSTRDDVSGLRQQLTNRLENTNGLTSGATKTAPQQLAMTDEYRAKKQELENLQKFRDVLATRTLQEETALKMPKTTMVEILEHAEVAEKPTLGESIRRAFGGKVESVARINLQRDVSEVPGVDGQRTLSGAYDPYFVQTETEVIQSQAVLDEVIKKLKLDETWSAKNGGKLTVPQTRELLRNNLDLRPRPGSTLFQIGFKSQKPDEAALVANTVAQVYQNYRSQQREGLSQNGIAQFKKELPDQDKKISQVTQELADLEKQVSRAQVDAPLPHVSPTALTPQPEVLTSTNAFSTFSLNVSDVSFKLAAASLEKGVMPDPGAIRSEEFINAFDYRDPEPAPGAPLAFAFDRVQYPFAQNRDLVRFGIKTAAAGRTPGRALNLVLLLDNSGSMERADRVQIIHEALRVLATQLQPQDTISVVTFARNARLQVDGWSGNRAAQVAQLVDGLTPEGGTNLEEAMRVAYETALRHYLAAGDNRVVLLTDGAANLGNVDPVALQAKVETNRKQGIALDCFGIGWEGYNDDLLETLSRHGDGRYGFINTPEAAVTDFVGQLAGALHVAAADVKAQIEFNPKRVTAYRQIGYAKHQLTKEQFRDNTVDAAEIGAAEEGNALYTVQINPAGEGPIGTVRVRFKVPGTSDYREHEWPLPYTGNAPTLEQGAPAMRLAATASAFSEWLGQSPFAAEVTPDALLNYLRGVPAVYGVDARPQKLEWMIRQAKSLEGK